MHDVIIILSIRASAELIAATYASGQVLMTIIQKIFVNRYTSYNGVVKLSIF